MSPPIASRLRLVFLPSVTASVLFAALAAAAGSVVLAGLAAGAAIALGLGWRQLERLARAEQQALDALLRGTQDSRMLLDMNGLLQRCREVGDVERVVAGMARRLLPGCAATLHVLPTAKEVVPQACCGDMRPARCAALRHGRMQLNADGASGACPCAPVGTDTLCLPIAPEDAMRAVLQFSGPVLPRSVQAQRTALAMAEAIGFALENLSIREGLRGQALRDPLTGLHNRRFLDEVSGTLAHQAARRGAPLAVAVLDLDHFKQLNDQHGHAVGDAVLRDVGELLATSLRRADIACRHGGEEFVIVLPDCDAVQAWGLMDALRQRIVARRLGGVTGHRVTCSIGVSALAEGGSIAEAITEADGALYAAKRAGRNRVVLASRITAAAA